jgi:predicted  nucleic acid-binding Zn-ribbon protein
MEIKDFNQAIERQKELSAKLMGRIKRLQRKKAPSIAATVKEQKALIAQAEKELAASEREKELAIKGWDQRIKERKSAIAHLKKGLKIIGGRP